MLKTLIMVLDTMEVIRCKPGDFGDCINEVELYIKAGYGVEQFWIF